MKKTRAEIIKELAAEIRYPMSSLVINDRGLPKTTPKKVIKMIDEANENIVRYQCKLEAILTAINLLAVEIENEDIPEQKLVMWS